MPDNAPLGDVAALFAHDPTLDALIVTSCADGSPVGLAPRRAVEDALKDRFARRVRTARDLAVTGIPVLDAQTPIDEATAVAEDNQDAATLKYGVIVTRDDGACLRAPADALLAWWAARARRLQAERDHARRALAKVNENRMMFLASMGHELKTPLNAIIGYADLILSETHGAIAPAKYRDYLRAAHDAGLHLLNVINGVLDIAKIDARSMELHDEPLALREIAESAISMVKTTADARQLRIALQVPGDLPPVLADEQLLRQILLNLLSNAIKFSPPAGKITVSATRGRRGNLRLTVQDRGPGIPPEDIAKVMQPFRQIDTDDARRFLGTGLGLPLVKAFTELHDGNFQLMSAEGKGTRAVVILPAGRVLDRSPGRQQEFAFTRPLSA